MIYFSLIQYMKICIIIYLLRFIIDKLFLYSSPVKKFYYERMILPSVKIWDSRRYKVIFDEIFILLEVAIVTFFYMLVYWAIPFHGIKKSFTFIFFILIFASIIKIRFVFIESNYPKSLFIFSIIRMTISYILHAIMLTILYNPLDINI